ncbi:hypothetical protein Tco_0954873 [Tanacetum coccineum]|uniref:F-box protein n=1 Tax=Tanacetum coccineum TaxID=301880 RepID=A0ABQ5E5K8_9ASTR
MLFGFGVHPVTLDPTVLKINYPYYGQGPWYVSVFTLSSRTWYKLESYCLPRESIRIKRSGQAVVGGKIFWVGSEKFYGDDGISYKLYMLVSFDLITHQFQVIDMPEEMLVGQYLPPYYISQLGDCIIISSSFKFVDFSIIYAWELQVDDGEVSWYRKLFTLPYPIEHDLKLIGFTKDKQPIVEASFVQQLHQSLQVFNPTFQIFQNLVVESNHGSISLALQGITNSSYCLITSVVIDSKLYYACPRSKSFDDEEKLTEKAGIFSGLDVFGDVNAAVIDHLDELSFIVMVEPYSIALAAVTCEPGVLQYFYTQGSTCERYVDHPTLCGRCYDVIAGQPPCVLSVVI